MGYFILFPFSVTAGSLRSGKEGFLMTRRSVLQRFLAVWAAALLLFALGCPSAWAAEGPQNSFGVSVKFWDEKNDTDAASNNGIDSARGATMTRQANGTFTLRLPIQSMTMLGMDCHLAGLTIGDIWYEGTMSGSFESGSAVLTIQNLPYSILTGEDVSQAIAVTCSLETDLSLLGELDVSARMSVWAS